MRRNSRFELTRNQRFGILGLIILSLILVFLNIVLPPYWSKKQYEKYPITWVVDSSHLENISASYEKKNSDQLNSFSPNTKGKKPVYIDVNKSGKEQFKKIRGIGDVLSERIVKYRSALGGFYDIHQIKEVYGISDSLYNAIKNQLFVSDYPLNKINVNQADFEELKRHPYISDLLAKQIISFREKVKTFESEQDIKKLYLMNEELYEKLYRYIEF